jgi:hypothetical protein
MLGRKNAHTDESRAARKYLEIALPGGHSLRRHLRKMKPDELVQLAYRLADFHAVLSERCGARSPFADWPGEARPNWVRRHDITQAAALFRPNQGLADLMGLTLQQLEQIVALPVAQVAQAAA